MAKKGSYGKRYTGAEKAAIVNEWIEEKLKDSPRSQVQFCKDNKISPITLNGWVRKGTDPAALESKTKSKKAAKAAKVAKTGKRGRPAAIKTGDDVAGLINAIKQHQAALVELKDKLRAAIDSL
jgi:hypothetical protein